MKFALSPLILYENADIFGETLFLPLLAFKNDFHKACCFIFKEMYFHSPLNLSLIDVMHA